MMKHPWLMGAVFLSIALSAYAIYTVRVLRAELGQHNEERLTRAKVKYRRIAEVEERLGRLNRTLRQVIEQPKPAATPSPENGDETQRARVEEIVGELEDIRTDLERVITEKVEAQVGQQLERLNQRKRNQSGEWEPPMAELAEELGLDEAQNEAVTSVFDGARDEVFALLSRRREDGGTLADDLAMDLKSRGDPGESMKRFFGRIVNETAPGSERSYLGELINLRGQVYDALEGELTQDQMAKLKTLRIDPLRVGTGYDPMKDYVEAKIQE